MESLNILLYYIYIYICNMLNLLSTLRNVLSKGTYILFKEHLTIPLTTPLPGATKLVALTLTERCRPLETQ